MDLMVVLLWFLVFSVIVVFLGTLNYFLGRPNSDVLATPKQFQPDLVNQQPQQQSTRNNTGNNRRKNSRNANKKKQKSAATVALLHENSNGNSSSISEDQPEKNTNLTENNIKTEQGESLIEFSIQQLTNEKQDQDEKFEDPMVIQETLIPSSLDPIEKEKEPIKQRSKDKINPINSKSRDFPSSNTNGRYSTPLIAPKQDSIVVSKPKANVAPVKQGTSSINTTHNESNQFLQANNSKSNEHSSSLDDIYSYSEHSSTHPRVQREEIENFTTKKFLRKKSATQTNKSSIQMDSSIKQNDVAPSAAKSKLNNNVHFESSIQSNRHVSFDSNGYSSESDILSESTSTTPLNNNKNHSFSFSEPTEYQGSSKEPEIRSSLSASNILLDKLLSIFDNVSFSTEDLELILKKLTNKQLSNRQEWQHLISTKTKNEKAIERILEETFHSQAKILAIELQIEKNRVLELTKTNVEMKNTIKHLQQPNDNMAPYQQTVLSYQMQLRRLTDENTHLLHQLHAYSMMPNSITELKQQQSVLDEQIRQISMRNSSLEKEIADGERAKKQAAEIYKKADAQKQERIEKMIDDLNKYKKIDRDLSALRTKHRELKDNLHEKIDEVTHERDELEKTCGQLKEKLQQYQPLKIKYEKLVQNKIQSSNLEKLQQELSELKGKNDLLRQRHVKIMEQLNKQSSRPEQHQKDQISQN